MLEFTTVQYVVGGLACLVIALIYFVMIRKELQ